MHIADTCCGGRKPNEIQQQQQQKEAVVTLKYSSIFVEKKHKKLQDEKVLAKGMVAFYSVIRTCGKK